MLCINESLWKFQNKIYVCLSVLYQRCYLVFRFFFILSACIHSQCWTTCKPKKVEISTHCGIHSPNIWNLLTRIRLICEALNFVCYYVWGLCENSAELIKTNNWMHVWVRKWAVVGLPEMHEKRESDLYTQTHTHNSWNIYFMLLTI